VRTDHDVLIRPIITEASTDALQLNKYTVKVNTLWIRGKKHRRRQYTVKSPDRKKAIVTLQPGDTIEAFNP
jgi:large subunit ribosomal protein L23